MGNEGTIELYMPVNYWARFSIQSGCDVYLDKEKIGKLMPGESGVLNADTKDFKVPAGQHSLMIAGSPWLLAGKLWQTETIEFHLSANERTRFECRVVSRYYYLLAMMIVLLILLAMNFGYQWLIIVALVSCIFILRLPDWVYRIKQVDY